MMIDEAKDILKEQCRKYLKKDIDSTTNLENLTAEYISTQLEIKRNTASSYLNKLWNDKEIIKINTRPVYYMDKLVIYEKYKVDVDKFLFDSIDDFKDYIASRKEIVRDPFNKLIGHEGSLYHQIEECKAAVTYPPNGLPVLILGDAGVGKSIFAQLMYEYSIEKDIIPSDAPFIILNCAEYADNQELLTGNLFGHMKGSFTGADSDKKGLIEEADGGFLFLDEVHRLSIKGQEKLFLFMDKGIYRRLGENTGYRKSQVRFIFATTEKPDKTFVETFLRRIPITVQIPSLMMRGENERIEMICRFFSEESRHMGINIKISENVLNAFLNNEFEGNVGELKSIIKCVCANAFMENVKKEEGEVEIKLSHLPDKLLKKYLSFTKENATSKVNAHSEILISSDVKLDYNHLFNKEFSFKKLYNEVFDLYEDLRYENIDRSKFINSSFVIINRYFDKFFFEINSFTDIDVRFEIIKRAVEEAFEIIRRDYGFKSYGNTVLVLSHYIYWRTRYGYLREKSDLRKHSHEIIEFLQKSYSKEYFIVERLIKHIEYALDVKIENEDRIIFVLYLKCINKNFNIDEIRALIVAHGYSTASSIANVANRLIGEYVFEAFDMPLDLSIEKLVSEIKDYINNIDTSKGIIILVDMGSLEKIYEALEDLSDGVIGIINNITTQVALDTGFKILQGMEVEEIMEKVTTNNRFNYKIIMPKKKRKRAIVTTCISGLGTANKIKKLLIESAGNSYKPNELSIIPCDYASLKRDGVNHYVFKSYQVLAILGTEDPDIPHIPYIALEDIISGEYNEKPLLSIFDEASVEKINQRFIKLFSLESVIEHLTILNPNKVINYIENAINELERSIGRRLSNGRKISLYIHLSCLIERIIQKSPITTYVNIDEFKKCHKDFIELTKKSFSVIEDAYNVELPISEIGYIYDIVTAK